MRLIASKILVLKKFFNFLHNLHPLSSQSIDHLYKLFLKNSILSLLFSTLKIQIFPSFCCFDHQKRYPFSVPPFQLITIHIFDKNMPLSDYFYINNTIMHSTVVVVKKEYEDSEQPSTQGPFKIEKLVDPNLKKFQPTGQWTELQSARYVAFLKVKRNQMERKPVRALWPTYKEMATFIGTRNFTQCKSHDQRNLSQFGNIASIIAYHTKTSNNFQHLVNEYQNQLALLAKAKSKQRIQKVQEINKHSMIPFQLHHKMPTEKHQFLPPTGQSYPPQQRQWYQNKKINGSQSHLMKTYTFNRAQFGSETSIDTMQRLSEMEKKKQWLECHAIFMVWMTKLNNLMCSP